MREDEKHKNQHENPNFWTSALTLQGSVTSKVYKNVLFCVIYSLIVFFITNKFPILKLPESPFAYAGGFLGLILVFRVNAGYDRWWEARKIWGSIVNSTRNLAILVKSYSKSDETQSTLQLIIALPILIKNHLRSIPELDEILDLVSEQDYKNLEHSTHTPNFISLRIAEKLACMHDQKTLSEFAFLKAEDLREQLVDSQGACERIWKTPMPLVMAIKIRRFIFLFLMALPFALDAHFIHDTLVVAIVSYSLFALDQIGIELQNPFALENLSHLPLNDICKTIKININEIFNSTP